MNTKYCVFGAGGQLGQRLREVLGDGHSYFGSGHGDGHLAVDITEFDAVFGAVKASGCQWIINCAAFTDVDGAENKAFHMRCRMVNTTGPSILAAVANHLDVGLCHISTDYVFGYDEKQDIPLADYHPAGPVNRYGRDKLRGETLVLGLPRRQGKVIRTSWLYGGPGDFVRTMLIIGAKAALDNSEFVSVKEDQVSTPTFARDLATRIPDLIRENRPAWPNIIHYVNKGHCSRLEWVKKIFELADINVPVIAADDDEFVLPAKRPKWSALQVDGHVSAIYPPRPWEDALAAYIEELKADGTISRNGQG
jgi:dTDP-4-dehydrorhamnose reductase